MLQTPNPISIVWCTLKGYINTPPVQKLCPELGLYIIIGWYLSTYNKYYIYNIIVIPWDVGICGHICYYVVLRGWIKRAARYYISNIYALYQLPIKTSGENRQMKQLGIFSAVTIE